MKNQANKAIQLLSSLTQRALSEIQAGSLSALSGRNAKLTRLYLNTLAESEKTALFERLQEGHLQTLVSFLSGMSNQKLGRFIQTVDQCWQSSGKDSLSSRLFGKAA